MKIGIYDPYLDTLGGGEKYILYLAKALSEKNKVILFWEDKTILDKAKIKFGIDLSKINIKKNIFSKETPLYKRVLESRKYDAVVYLSNGSIPFLASKRLYLHFQFPTEWVGINSIKTKIKLARVTDFICNSEFTKSYIDKEYKVKSKILYPPVDIRYSKKEKKQNIILHVGRFSSNNIEGDDYKKQGVMVEVFKKMINEGLAEWKFVLVISLRDEDKDKFNILQQQAEGYPIEFVLNPDSKQLWDIYSKTKIYWHATGFGENLQENPELTEHFGISTCEAMGALAVPIVINAGGQKEIVKDGENGYLWNSTEELQKRTIQLIKNIKKLDEFAKKARESVIRFNEKQFSKRAVKLIR